ELDDEGVEPDPAVAEHDLGDLLGGPRPERDVSLDPRHRGPVVLEPRPSDPLGLGLRRADRDLAAERPLDRVRVAPDRRTVLPEDPVLAGDRLGRPEDVPDV